ncbi:protein UXT homolog [Ischnura elegans]|uniref:protein UXT homolog n=1 Tax=Ischnura elegans TaxID=197161 RepID=UPI001ED8A492|nr:protein UXT homolog [Ischnura elegans]XP_046383235.1 protein UXT homolog [Ischnura elegans]XP_046383236.1 protein UXT homolog [Ischnura elegans]
MDFDRSRKVEEVECFINDVLKEDLRKVYENREKIHGKIRDYVLLKDTVQNIIDGKFPEDGLKTKIDIGCNFYVQGNVTDPSTVFVHIGYGFFLEFPLRDAVPFINKRINYLSDLANKDSKSCATIKAYIKVLQESLPHVQDASEKQRKL